MKYVVQKVPSRSIDQLTAVLPELHVIEDTVKQPYDAFVDCFRWAGEEAFVRFEDDSILCTAFRARIEAAIAAYPTAFLSFCTFRKTAPPSPWPAVDWLNGADFEVTSCHYTPPGFAPLLVRYYESGLYRWKERYPWGIDLLLAQFLRRIDVPIGIYFPNLVQHMDLQSTLVKGRSRRRQSLFFADGVDWS